MIEFHNQSGLEFSDISSEAGRKYQFPGGHVVTIDNPLYLNVSASGGHRLFDAKGVMHYIPAGWVHLSWTVRDGAPHIVK